MEKKKDEASESVKNFVKGIGLPNGTLDRYLKRVEKPNSKYLMETACFLWFLDAQIPFNQFDNPLFKQFLLEANVADFPSKTTFTLSLLPAIYNFCTTKMVAILKACSSYFVSFDGWSKLGMKFMSQTYHCITTTDFSYRALLLDLIPMGCAQFREVVSASLDSRQQHWVLLAGKPLLAAGIHHSGQSCVHPFCRELISKVELPMLTERPKLVVWIFGQKICRNARITNSKKSTKRVKSLPRSSHSIFNLLVYLYSTSRPMLKCR